MSKHKSRREFAKTVALMAAAPLVVAGQQPTARAAQPAEPPGTIAASAQGLTEIVRSRHGKHLNEEQLKRIRQRIEGGLRSAERLKRARLLNSDEPDFIFGADVP